MPALAEVEALAMELSVSDRELLIYHLASTLPEGLDYDQLAYELEGAAEAGRRRKEMDDDPSACLTLEELKRAVGR